jgi:hypothetical protein
VRGLQRQLPAEAITIHHFSDGQLTAQIEALITLREKKAA